MNRLFSIGLLLVLILVIGGGIFFLKTKEQKLVPPKNTGKVVPTVSDLRSTIISLTPQNDSGEKGIALLRQTDKGLQVDVVLDPGFPQDLMQPAHIHKGTCAELGDVVYPLTDVKNGSSTTVLQTTLAGLKKQLPLAVNIHKSSQESGVYVSCADVTGIL